MKTIFIISGKSGSGKDTFANIMREKLEEKNYKCITLHYADLVKYYCSQYYNWNGIKDEAGRTLLQTLGTDKVRTKFPDYWAEAIAKFLAAAANDFDFAFIPDARFPNEIEVVKKYNKNVVCIRIERLINEETKYINPAFTPQQLAHPSEISLDDYPDFNYIIENYDNNLDLLNESAETIIGLSI